MLSDACLEARRRGLTLFPVAVVDLVARGLSLGRLVASTAMRHTALGQVTHVTTGGGWGEIAYGSGIERGELEVVRTHVTFSDPTGELIRQLKTYDPRGSEARIDWAAPGLVDTDWTPLFRGVLEDWEREGLTTRIILKTDDTLLRTEVPPHKIAKAVWPSAADSTVYETAQPLCMGIFDSFAITGRGMVPCLNVRYDEALGFWWIVSLGHVVEIRRLYYDGVAQADTIWTTRRGVWGGSLATFVEITAGSQPEKGVVVSCDLEGPDDSGLYSGTAVTNPIRQLRTVLEEYAFREPPLGAWRGAHALIEASEWDAAETWFEDRNRAESARRWGADQNPETAAEVVQSFMDAHLFARLHWTPNGTLGIFIIDPDDVDPEALAHLDVGLHGTGGTLRQEPGDSREVYTHLRQPYMWSPAEQKFLAALAVHDVAAAPVKVPLDVPNVWTQGRYLQE
jgi:hypothetical protein